MEPPGDEEPHRAGGAPRDAGDDERRIHEGFMREAMQMAEAALAAHETPVGCVVVAEGAVVARGMNATSRTRNGTRHAEFVAVAALLGGGGGGAALLRRCDVYVTVEPCIMCASLLRQSGVRCVYFGAANARFGGAGGVLRVHDEPGRDAALGVSGGWLRDEAIMLLRRFYVQENENAPKPRSKRDRRLKTEIEPDPSVGRRVPAHELAERQRASAEPADAG